MGLVYPDLKPSFVPNTIDAFLKHPSILRVPDDADDGDVDGVVKRLQEEMDLIQDFHPRLPLSMLLLNHALVVLKRHTYDHEAVLQHFIPLNTDNSQGVPAQNMQSNNPTHDDDDDDDDEKKNWMTSVQLWTPPPSKLPPPTKHLAVASPKEDANTTLTRAHHLTPTYPSTSIIPPIYPAFQEFTQLDKAETVPLASIRHPKHGGTPNMPDPTHASPLRPSNPHPTARKQRRCWSPELHRRFVDALTQLGGAQVATPKQIRELMGVDGLTNDEVKSHLQKYRLHARRVPKNSAASINENGNDLTGSWTSQDPCSKSSKPSSSQSGSPEGPLQLHGLTEGTSTTADDSMDDEDDEKSDSYSWKEQVHRPGNDYV